VFGCEADLQAEEVKVLAMDDAAFDQWGKRFSLDHVAQFWGCGPLLPGKWI
jgi:hypothetical protein